MRYLVLRWTHLCAAVLLLITVNPSVLAEPAKPARIEVQADKILGPVNRKVLGSNVLAANKWIIHGVDWKKFPASRFAYIRTGGGVWDPLRCGPTRRR